MLCVFNSINKQHALLMKRGLYEPTTLILCLLHLSLPIMWESVADPTWSEPSLRHGVQKLYSVKLYPAFCYPIPTSNQTFFVYCQRYLHFGWTHEFVNSPKKTLIIALHPPKTNTKKKSCHNDEFMVTGGFGCCQHDKLQCRQWALCWV